MVHILCVYATHMFGYSKIRKDIAAIKNLPHIKPYAALKYCVLVPMTFKPILFITAYCSVHDVAHAFLFILLHSMKNLEKIILGLITFHFPNKLRVSLS